MLVAVSNQLSNSTYSHLVQRPAVHTEGTLRRSTRTGAAISTQLSPRYSCSILQMTLIDDKCAKSVETARKHRSAFHPKLPNCQSHRPASSVFWLHCSKHSSPHHGNEDEENFITYSDSQTTTFVHMTDTGFVINEYTSQYNLSMDSKQNVKSKQQSVESKMGR